MQNLKGKTALVTGGGRGLGKAVALALAAEGVNVAITGRNENNLKSVAAEIESKGVKYLILFLMLLIKSKFLLR